MPAEPVHDEPTDFRGAMRHQLHAKLQRPRTMCTPSLLDPSTDGGRRRELLEETVAMAVDKAVLLRPTPQAVLAPRQILLPCSSIRPTQRALKALLATTRRIALTPLEPVCSGKLSKPRAIGKLAKRPRMPLLLTTRVHVFTRSVSQENAGLTLLERCHVL